MPAAPVIHTLRQADGTTFAARQWGDERQHGWETLDGYTIIFNTATGNWHYATLDTAGRLVPSPRVVGKDLPVPSVPKHLRPLAGENSAKQSIAVPFALDYQKVVPSTGTAYLPVLLINFNNTATTYTPPQFDTLLFGLGNNSMSDYYDEVSYFNFALLGNVFGWYTAAHSHDYYGQNVSTGGTDQWPGDLVYEAVQAADPTVDFSLYDNDGDCYVDVVAVVHQGTGEEASGNPTDIWSHRWSLNAAQNAGRSHQGEYTTNDPCPAGGQIKVNDYILQPEQLSGGNMITVGVFCHEFGHALGLPDLYDTDNSSQGIGNWGLMGGGSWNKSSRPGDRPAHLSAWSKYRLGWVTPTQVEGTLPDEPIEPAAQSADVYQLLYGSPDKGGEYFLIENRQKSGFDAGLPGTGLLIWHIEENKTNNKEECYPPSNCSTTHYKVALVQADNRWDLEKNQNRGDAGDPYPGSSNNTNFNDSSTPASKIWDGRSSNAGAINIRKSGSTMYATLFAKAPWAKTYGGPKEDFASAIQQTTDGGYIVAGWTYSFGDGSYGDAWVLKLDGEGNILWQKTYGSSEHYEFIVAIQQTTDGGYIAVGVAESLDTDDDIWVLKLDGDGNVLWQKTYSPGGSGWESAYAIRQTSDGGYIVAGSRGDDRAFEAWVLKLDASGNIQWQKAFEFTHDARAIQQTSDGGYIVAVEYPSFLILKLDASGNIQWQKAPADNGNIYPGNHPSAIQQTSDGGYIVAGMTETYATAGGYWDIWVLKLDASGNIQWQKTYGGGGSDTAFAIQQTADGGYIVAGETDSFSTDYDFWVLKLDTGGNIQWQKTYDGLTFFPDDSARSIQQTSDGGYIVAGITQTFGDFADILVLKLDANGDIAGCPFQSAPHVVVQDTHLTAIDDDANPYTTAATGTAVSLTSSDTNAAPSGVCLVQQQYTLTVTISGTGLGTVTSNPTGIDCGADCTQDYLEDTLVTLTATPDPDSSFAGWSGDCTTTGPNQAQVTMDADKTCTATFTRVNALTLSLNQSSFQSGDTLILTATVTPGATPQRVDVYVALQLPNGLRLFLQQNGRLIRAVRPLVRNWPVTLFNGELFRHTFRGTEPAGNYTWEGAFTEAGTGTVIGEVSQAPFSFTP
ncbi:MAG: M6 family metalloprotease domain-containing protein [Nitrospinota bacterium]|nr:MAG: M6 family metalloprotease domain-containing protein [Nitrospinota bacterium]